MNLFLVNFPILYTLNIFLPHCVLIILLSSQFQLLTLSYMQYLNTSACIITSLFLCSRNYYTVCPTHYWTRHWSYCNEIWTGVHLLCEKWRGMYLYCVSVTRLIVVTRSSGPPASGKVIKEMPGSVASGTSYILYYDLFHIQKFCYLPWISKMWNKLQL